MSSTKPSHLRLVRLIDETNTGCDTVTKGDRDMKTYKVYFRFEGKLDSAMVDATTSYQAKWKIISRFNNSVVAKVVEIS